MKRNLLIVAIALLAVAFVSCQKDGVYKPKKRIAKVYNEWTRTTVSTDADGSRTETVTQNPYVAQEWTWGDKTLESIMSKDKDGNVVNNVKFAYDDKNRIVSVAETGDDKIEYAYNDDKKLQSIKAYEGTDLVLSMEYAYEDKLPKTITTTWYFEYKKMSPLAKMVIPTFVSEAMQRTEIQSKAVVTYVMTSTIEWDGKNISQVVTNVENESPSTITYEYDGKANPYYGMYGMMEYDFDIACYSKNNVVKSTNSYTEEGKTVTEVEEYVYEYDGKYPTKVTVTDVRESTVLGVNHKVTMVNTTTYEYTK